MQYAPTHSSASVAARTLDITAHSHAEAQREPVICTDPQRVGAYCIRPRCMPLIAPSLKPSATTRFLADGTATMCRAKPCLRLIGDRHLDSFNGYSFFLSLCVLKPI